MGQVNGYRAVVDTKRVDFEYSTGITDGRSSIGCAWQTPTNQAAALW
jgi:hypothetical protein